MFVVEVNQLLPVLSLAWHRTLAAARAGVRVHRETRLRGRDGFFIGVGFVFVYACAVLLRFRFGVTFGLGFGLKVGVSSWFSAG